MSESSPPAFQFYPKDFLADTLAMPVETRGVYITLLCYQWVNGSIPEDDRAIARICSLTTADLQQHWEHLTPKFVEHPEQTGTLVNPRMERERQKQSDFREKRAAAGRKSGESRRNKSRTQSNSSSSSSSSDKHRSASQTSPRHPFGKDAQSDLEAQPNNKPKSTPKPSTLVCPHEKIVELYHECLPDRPQVRVMSETRKKHLRARWREDPKRQNLEWWRKYFEYIGRQPFLMGETKGEWPGVDFDFVIRQSSLIKVIEGKYEQ